MPPKKANQPRKSSSVMQKKEVFDPRRLQYVLDHYDELKEEISKLSRHDDETTKRQITAFYSMRKDFVINGEKLAYSPITYHQKRGMGRFFANHGNSMQGIARSVRQLSSKDLYYDIDISNAHPVILLHECKRLGIKCEHLEYYVNNRQKCLQDMANMGYMEGKIEVEWPEQAAKEWAKKQYLKITNWGEDDSTGTVKPGTHIPKTYTQHAKLYMQELRENAHIAFSTKQVGKKDGSIVNEPTEGFLEFMKVKQESGKETNFHASYMNYAILCEKENQALQSMMKSFSAVKPHLAEFFIPCFDGVMIPKIDFQTGELIPLEEWNLNAAMECVKEDTGILLLIEEKPMNNPLQISDEVIPEYCPLDFYDFSTYKLISGNPDQVFDLETVERFVKNNIFILEQPSEKNSSELFSFITKHVRKDVEDIGVAEEFTEYRIDDPARLIRSLDRYCKINNPHHDPDFYEANKDKPKTKECWQDKRMMPYIQLKPNEQLELGHYVREMKKLGKLETFQELDYIPTLKPEPMLMAGKSRKFNTFRGFPWVGKSPANRIEITDSLFYKHVYEIMFNGNSEHFNRFMDWWADMFQDPLNHKPYLPILWGDKGTFKSELIKTIIATIGAHNAVTIIKTGRFFGQFNAAHTGMILQVFEEVADGKINHEFWQVLKGEMTEKTILKEEKGKDEKKVRNFARKVFVSNSPPPAPEPGERRVEAYKVGNKHANDSAYYGQLINEVRNQDFIICLFQWLCERRYNPNNLRDFKRSEETNAAILRGLPSAIQFIIEYVQDTYPAFDDKIAPVEHDKSWRMSAERLNKLYRDKHQKASENTLRDQLESLGMKRDKQRVEGYNGPVQCYSIYPPRVEELVRSYTKIPTFKLQLAQGEDPLKDQPLGFQHLARLNRIEELKKQIELETAICRQLEDSMMYEKRQIRSPEPNHAS